jgi:hypothetical protein
MIMEKYLLNWLKNQQENVDRIISDAANAFYHRNCNNSNFAFDLAECQSESFNLINNKDLCYDRPNTAFTYSLWYHARRVNTFIKFFATAILNTEDRVIEIFDLGAGTGAVQFAVGLVVLGMKEMGHKVPSVRVINIDSSPIMLSYNEGFLWKSFQKYYPSITHDKQFVAEYSVNSWNVNVALRATNPWLVASYLFDISDQKELVAKDFISLIDYYKPSTFLLLTSSQPEKIKLFEHVLTNAKSLGYITEKVQDSTLLFDGSLNEVNKFRVGLNQKYAGRGLGNYASWRESGFIGAILRQQNRNLSLSAPVDIHSLNLYNPKIKVRRDVQLSEEQKKASSFSGRPSIIIGPAGSGKSIVISEKIKSICELSGYSPGFKVLITSFNRGLIKKIGDWLEELLHGKYQKREFVLDAHGFEHEACHFYFLNSNEPNISLLNFDLLPTRIGNCTAGRVILDKQHHFIIRDYIAEVKRTKKILDTRYDNVLRPDFIFEEYHRIFYGLQVKSKSEYLAVKREGRWLPLNKERRELVYDCIEKYQAHIDRNNLESFTTRRDLFLKKLKTNAITTRFNYILVDEFQDCTKADYEIFYSLIKDVNNLTLAGDLAQAIHIGKSADVPRDDRMKRRQHFLLNGSYRLPHRISQSIFKLSSVIVDRWKKNEATKEITPVKNSPPGARPIIVYAATLDNMAAKVQAIVNAYRDYDINMVTILEKDEELCKSLKDLSIQAETDTILKLKGLEKECILWSTRIAIDDENEAYEFVYTILTRTSCILIIALSDSTQKVFKKIINLLDREKTILWDSETKSKYDSFCEVVETEMIVEEA